MRRRQVLRTCVVAIDARHGGKNAANEMGGSARRLRVPSNPVWSQVLAGLSLSGAIAGSVRSAS